MAGKRDEVTIAEVAEAIYQKQRYHAQYPARAA